MTMTNEELLNVFKTNANKRPFQLADGTIEMYLKNINYFLESIGNKNILEITRKDVKQYMLALQTSDSTYNQRLASIRTLYKVLAYILDDENIIDVTFGLVAISKVEHEHKVPLTELERKLILKHCKNDRDYAIVLTLLSSGIRISELIALTLDDYNNRDNDGKITLTITKGSKVRNIWLNEDVCKAIDKYLTTRKICDYNNLFISNGGTPMLQSSCARTMKILAKRAGLDNDRIDKICCHTMRSSYASNLADKGVSIQKIATAMGHSNIQTTYNSYITMDDSEVMTAFM